MIEQILDKLDAYPTLIQRYTEAVNLMSESEDEKVIAALEKYIDDLRVYQVGLIKAIKAGEETAFNDLLQVKDIRNFIYHYAWHIRKYYNYRYKEDDIINEIKYQIFLLVKNNYRLYNQPNEISLLINSMRRWIKQKVGSELKETYRPKSDSFLPPMSNIEDQSYDGTETWVKEVAAKILTPEDQKVFDLRFFNNWGYKKIGMEMGKSKDAIQRRYEKILLQIKGYLEGVGEWRK